MSETALQACIAKAICKSGKFETGNGTCALTCMDQLGDARQNCRHAERIHDKLAEQIASAIAAWNARPGGDEAVRSALSIACDRLQEFLDTFGDMRDYVTQSDIDDWRKNALRTQGAAIREAEAAGEARGRAMERERIKDALDFRLNDYLCEMREGYDDSIVGFNEAWDVVRKYFKSIRARTDKEPSDD